MTLPPHPGVRRSHRQGEIEAGEPGTPWAWAESSISIGVLAVMTLLPIAEMSGRLVIGRGFISGALPVLQHLTLWVAMLGAALAARFDRLLRLSTVAALPKRLRPGARKLAAMVAVAVTSSLTWASFDLMRIERGAGDVLAWGIPVWAAIAVMPATLGLIGFRLLWGASERWQGRAFAALGLLVPVAYHLFPTLQQPGLVGPALLVVVLAIVLGMPIFAGIAGAALLLFLADGTPINAVPGETYSLSTNAILPAIPLFALGGFILSEGGSSRRLTRLFQAWFGWMPGGLAVVTTLVLAFFTPLTGASGITIVSMGGLLLPVLVRARYPQQTSIGLVTVSGSVGLLFFPSLPVILYGFYADQPIDRLFVGGLIPGFLLVLGVAAWGAWKGVRLGASRSAFEWGEAWQSVRLAKWELLLPIVILGSFFGGVATLVEAAAISVVYALIVECVLHRDLDPWRELPAVFVRCATLVGGFMIILGVALSFTDYLILADIPTLALDWVQAHIESRLVFLLALNVLLLVVGALMDIYSAIIVVVPLVYPIAMAYGVDPIHLGIIFLANMELGYLMPPMGENLFLASYRFEQPLSRVYRSTLPFAVILLITVLLITYVPVLTLGPVEWLLP